VPGKPFIEKQDIKQKRPDDEKLTDGKVKGLGSLKDNDDAKAQEGVDQPYQDTGAYGLNEIEHGDLQEKPIIPHMGDSATDKRSA
jgi:hypothetical protein